MFTANTKHDLESLLGQQAAAAPAPVVEAAPVSAWFSVSDEGVVVDPLVVMTLAPGTRRERTAIGVVDQRDRPTLVQLPGVEAATLTSGAGRRATDEFVTGGQAGGRGVSSTAASRYGEAKARSGVTPPLLSSEALQFPAPPLVDESAWMRERIWRRVAMRIESLSATGESGSATA